MKIAIILPTYNNSSDTLACLESIHQNTKDYTVIWVDDASSESHFAPVSDFLKQKSISHHIIRNDVNEGFVRSVNRGLSHFLQTDCSAVIVQNNDTIVYPNWAENLARVLNSAPKWGAVGSLTNEGRQCLSYLQKRYTKSKIPESASLAWGTDAELAAYLATEFSGETLEIFDRLAFFATIFSRKAVEDVGLLDPLYGKGYYDDDDYCERLMRSGYSLGIALDTFVTHHTERTFSTAVANGSWEKEKALLYQKNRRLFEEKFAYDRTDSLAHFANDPHTLRVAGEHYLTQTHLLRSEIESMQKSFFWKVRSFYLKIKSWILRK